MLNGLIDLLNDQTPLYPPWGRIVVVACLFALAWVVSRAAARVAHQVLRWHDRRHSDDARDDLDERIASLKRH